MQGKIGLIMLLGVAAMVTLGNNECSIDWPEPPFDTTGEYTGTWQGNSNEEQVQTVVACPLTMTLTQDVTAEYPGDHAVSGTVVIDYSCIELPEWMEDPVPSTAEVGGLLEDNNKLTLLSGGCGTGACLVFALAGEGEDLDQDGHMDQYSGAWSFTILLAGVQPFGFTGTFEVTANP